MSRVGEIVERLGEFGDGRHANLVEVEIRLHEPSEGPLSRVGRRVFEAAGQEHLLEDRPRGGGDNGLVLGLEGLEELGKERSPRRDFLRH